jgi:medium-chain acyl-[acyl-carrier-protein] hydrolase
MPPTPSAGNRWIAYTQPRADAAMRLFCFPYAGGGASAFRGWARDLPPQVDVCLVQYPGRETRITEPVHTALSTLVRAAADGLAPLLDRPFAFFGHSMGALVAFELARLLQREGKRAPARLFVSAFRSPLLPFHTLLPFDLPTEEFKRRLRALDGTPKEALDSPELMDFILPILRADCQVCDQYRIVDRSPLPCPITALGGLDDPEGGRDEMAQWQDLSAPGFALQMFEGGHFYQHGCRDELLATLRQALQALA